MLRFFSCRAAVSLALLLFSSASRAQDVDADSSLPTFSSSADSKPLPDAPSARQPASPMRLPKEPYAEGGYAGPFGMHASCGGGLNLAQGRSNGTMAMCGVGFKLIPFSAMEIGGLKLQDGSAHFYLSEDASVPLTRVIKRLHGEPVGILGYTKIVGDSNRLDYGLAWEHHVGPQQSIGLEMRDYLRFTDSLQHGVLLRLVLVGGGDIND